MFGTCSPNSVFNRRVVFGTCSPNSVFNSDSLAGFSQERRLHMQMFATGY